MEFYLLNHDPKTYIIVFQTILIIFLLVSFLVLRRRQNSANATEQNLRLARQFSFRIQQAHEEERVRISREIHDELGQSLTVLKMEVFLLKKHFDQNSEPFHKAENILRSLDTIIHSVRNIVADLRPAALEDLGFEAAAEWWLGTVQNRTGISCEFKSEADDSLLSTERSSALFRILQEAVTNAIRHSHTDKIEVQLSSELSRIKLEVRDQGVGFDSHAKLNSGSGLAGIKERLHPFDGEFEIESAKDYGTKVVVWIPFSKGEVL